MGPETPKNRGRLGLKSLRGNRFYKCHKNTLRKNEEEAVVVALGAAGDSFCTVHERRHAILANFK
jgi:hypothetical protein